MATTKNILPFLSSRKQGFTLIELSIVLVVIGLIIGGVLVGTDLVRAAGVRATIAQIEKFNTAVNTFNSKYGALPGDLNGLVATQFGFTPRGTHACQGNGDGVIQGCANALYTTASGTSETAGETVMFWVDLTTANGMNINLIDGGFNTAQETVPAGNTGYSGTFTDLWLPAAKLGQGNSIYVYSQNGINYYSMSRIANVLSASNFISYPALTVRQAYNIDQKIDDGFPQTGNVTTLYLYGSLTWEGGDTGSTDTTTATPPSAATCYDDGGSTGARRTYSLSQNNGNGVNCALSFKFQ